MVPIPPEYLPLPPLPEGKTQWVGRGRFDGQRHRAHGSDVYFYCYQRNDWFRTNYFSYSPLHIEAI